MMAEDHVTILAVLEHRASDREREGIDGVLRIDSGHRNRVQDVGLGRTEEGERESGVERLTAALAGVEMYIGPQMPAGDRARLQRSGRSAIREKGTRVERLVTRLEGHLLLTGGQRQQHQGHQAPAQSMASLALHIFRPPV
jgi:hypothetical protein